MHESGTMDQTIMHGIFVGPAGAGKSSLLKRLLHKKLDPIRTSTKAVEKSLLVQVRDVSTTVSGFDWEETKDPILQGSVLIGHLSTKIEQQASRQLSTKTEQQASGQLSTKAEQASGQLSTKQKEDTVTRLPTHLPKKESTAIQEKLSIGDTISDQPREVTSASQSTRSRFSRSIGFFQDVLSKQGVSGLKQHLDNRWTLYLTDSGGQPEFQELLPALVVGPCVFFVVLPLNKDLNSKYEVEYERPDKQKHMQIYLSSLTIIEDLLRSLASIAWSCVVVRIIY